MAAFSGQRFQSLLTAVHKIKFYYLCLGASLSEPHYSYSWLQLAAYKCLPLALHGRKSTGKLDNLLSALEFVGSESPPVR